MSYLSSSGAASRRLVICLLPSPARQRGGYAGLRKEEGLKNIREVVGITIERMVEHGEPISEQPETEVKISSEPVVAVTV
ncbi:MAG: hypothetical protein ACUVTR_06590 [Dehalococcoidia bacterium]